MAWQTSWVYQTSSQWHDRLLVFTKLVANDMTDFLIVFTKLSSQWHDRLLVFTKIVANDTIFVFTKLAVNEMTDFLCLPKE